MQRWGIRHGLAVAWIFLCGSTTGTLAQSGPLLPSTTKTNIVVLSFEGMVEVLKRGASVWMEASTNTPYNILTPGDALRTLRNSRAVLRLSNFTEQRLGAFCLVRILGEPHQPTALEILKGMSYFIHRDRPEEHRIRTPTVAMGVRGTEFAVDVSALDGTTIVSLFDGVVEMSNPFGQLRLESGWQGIARPNQAPVRTPALVYGTGLIQWALYYPGILDLEDLKPALDSEQALAASLSAYRAGDLGGAIKSYPAERQPATPMETCYLSAMLLSVGQVTEAEMLLEPLPADAGEGPIARLARALRLVIGAVRGDSQRSPLPQPSLQTHASAKAELLELATEWLAQSYDLQSRAELEKALLAAREAVAISPSFSFGWARVAELEFSFGDIRRAQRALDRSLALAPRNAQAVALKGFLASAENRIDEAVEHFNRAIALDGALGNAWLGRGLCRIRQGRLEEGRLDLQTAASVEPQRAVLRSYLGKAFGDIGDAVRAEKELSRARRLDPNDPTAWLYSALLNQNQSRINQAVHDLETSQILGDNRQVYRSELLLDQDRAVRSANLGSIYQDAGMKEHGLREAVLALSEDYANSSAHLFVSDSFNTLRDPTRINLRFETVWFNELLLANLLAPVGAGRLAQSISQQEYSKLFEADGLGLASTSEARSDGQFQELASHYGTFGNTEYALDLDYRRHEGVRPNNELSSIEWYSTIKHQITPQDSVLLLTKYQDYHSGDNRQLFDESEVHPYFFFDETQEPIVLGGYHRAWSPGSHTLLLGGRLQNEQRFGDRRYIVPVLIVPTIIPFPIANKFREDFDLDYRTEFEAYTAEVQHILQTHRQTVIIGGRLQGGDFYARTILTNPRIVQFVWATPAADIASTDDFGRATAYAYYTLQPIDNLRLTGGMVYDHIEYPVTFQSPPNVPGERSNDQWGPKAALVWQPWNRVSVRGLYSRSLGGLSLDQSYRLEPTQLAGFSQAYRTIIPESLVGSVAAPKFEVQGAALDLQIGPATYLGVQGEILASDVKRSTGSMALIGNADTGVPYAFPEELEYDEKSLAVTLNQLLSDRWSVGSQYKFTHTELETFHPWVLPFMEPPKFTNEADFHQFRLFGLFNHPSGFFAQLESLWFLQENDPLPDEDFWQWNVMAGYRLPNRRAELAMGLLNVTDQDYQLNPLSAYQELARERVFFTRFKFRF